MTSEQITESRKIGDRLVRAGRALRAAQKTADAAKIASAERSLAKARAMRDAFVAPFVVDFSAPQRIRATFRSPWSGPSHSGNPTHGVHVQIVDMVLDHVEISGPQYVATAIVSDVGGPTTGARSAPSIMGIAWHAIDDHIARGVIEVMS